MSVEKWDLDYCTECKYEDKWKCLAEKITMLNIPVIDLTKGGD